MVINRHLLTLHFCYIIKAVREKFPTNPNLLRGEEMKKVRLSYMLFALVAALALALSACGPQPTEAPEPTQAPPTTAPEPTEVMTEEPTEEPMEEIGSPEHPIKVLFVPSVDAQVIVSGGEIMAQALNEATGLTFEVVVPTSYAATIEEMCASPNDTMASSPVSVTRSPASCAVWT
jgi:ABC-type phosphate/phosphonate transport system substrate-binding protein